MINALKTIKITGGHFEQQTELTDIFANNINIVYGRNGSGKSSITSAVKDSLSQEGEGSYTVEYGWTLSEDDKKNIFIFNEQFIEDYVKIKRDGLKTLVMLGEQIDIDKEIEKETINLNSTTAQQDGIQSKIDEYNDESIEFSCAYLYKKIRQCLNAENNWADRDMHIKSLRRKASVNSDLINELHTFSEETQNISLQEEKKGLLSDIERYIKSQGVMHCPDVFFKYTLPRSIQEINSIISRKVIRPQLGEKEEQILTILASQHNHLAEAKEYFTKENSNLCPFCFQDTSTEYKKSLLKRIEELLRQESEKFKNEIEDLIRLLSNIAPVTPSNQARPFIEAELEELENNRRKINEELLRIIDILHARIKDLYTETPKLIDNRVSDFITSYNTKIDAINQIIMKTNEVAQNRETERLRLLRQNMLIAYAEHAELIDAYIKQSNELKTLIRQKDIFSTLINEIKTKIAGLKQKKHNTNLPLEMMNDILSFIFFDANRIKLVPSSGVYSLHVNGKAIPPSKVSVGERNAIALSYFFASICQGKTKGKRYSDEVLIILDDPVSSFDFENKVGIISALRWQISSILQANINSKITIFSHDISTVQDIIKMADDLVKTPNENLSKLTCALAQLRNKKLDYLFTRIKDRTRSPKFKKWNAYGELIQSVYNFASTNGETDELASIPIGNNIRKMLEAYSTFVYSKGFSEMLRTVSITPPLPEAEQALYENCMARLILNDDSHMQEKANALNIAADNFSFSERQKIAQAALKFLYRLNEQHVAAYLSDTEIAVINAWQLC